MQGTSASILGLKDPTGGGAISVDISTTEPTDAANEASAPLACAPEQEKHCTGEAHTPTESMSPTRCN